MERIEGATERKGTVGGGRGKGNGGRERGRKRGWKGKRGWEGKSRERSPPSQTFRQHDAPGFSVNFTEFGVYVMQDQHVGLSCLVSTYVDHIHSRINEPSD